MKKCKLKLAKFLNWLLSSYFGRVKKTFQQRHTAVFPDSHRKSENWAPCHWNSTLAAQPPLPLLPGTGPSVTVAAQLEGRKCLNMGTRAVSLASATGGIAVSMTSSRGRRRAGTLKRMMHRGDISIHTRVHTHACTHKHTQLTVLCARFNDTVVMTQQILKTNESFTSFCLWFILNIWYGNFLNCFLLNE